METKEPIKLVAGDSIKWKRKLDDYLPSAGWSLTYFLVDTANRIQIDTTGDADDYHVVGVTALVSSAWNSGKYKWQAFVSDGTDRFKVDEGSIEIEPDFSQMATGYDARSHAQKVYELLEDLIEGRATTDTVSLSLGGKSVQKMGSSELISWYRYYEKKYLKEKRLEAMANGNSGNNTIRTKF